MSSIIRDGDTFHGISVFGRGVFTNDKNARVTYAGQYRDGHACGLGVTTNYNGTKVYAEHGPDGKFDGRCLDRWAHGDTYYFLYERGEQTEAAAVFAEGSCYYNGKACAPDDPRLLALIAQVAPVEVRPAAQAPHPPLSRPLAPKQSSDGSAGPFCPRRRWRPPWPPRCTPTPHAVAGGRRAQVNDSRTAQHDHAVTRARAFLRYWSHWSQPSCTPPPSGAHRGSVQAAPLPCYSPARRRTEHAATRGGAACLFAHVARRDPFFRRSLLAWLFILDIPFGLAGRGSRGQPATALGGACAAANQVRRGTLGVLTRGS
jgi:hypothetical protein